MLSRMRRGSTNYSVYVENLLEIPLSVRPKRIPATSQLERTSLKYFLLKYFPSDTPVSTRLCD
jgi:hypothetical protein